MPADPEGRAWVDMQVMLMSISLYQCQAVHIDHSCPGFFRVATATTCWVIEFRDYLQPTITTFYMAVSIGAEYFCQIINLHPLQENLWADLVLGGYQHAFCFRHFHTCPVWAASATFKYRVLQWVHQMTRLHTRPNAFSSSTNAMYTCCVLLMARNVSCNWRTMNMAYVVLRPGLKPNCISSMRTCCWGKFAATLSRIFMAWGRFKNTYDLLNPRAHKVSMFYKIHIFQYMGNVSCVEFQSSFWNSTQNILHNHWKMCISFMGENLRALRFKSL